MNLNNNLTKSKIRIIPLGGVKEIGMNMMAIEYGNEVLIVDCGFMFPKYHMLGIDYVIPDTTYLEGKNITALLLTHGHEDHIGAIPHFLRKFPNIDIYGSGLTLAFLRAKLNDYKNEYKNVSIKELPPRQKMKIGSNFEIEFIRVNHSIPDGVGIAITTPLGVIIHTGDFKIDLNPITDTFIDLYKFAEYGEKGVLLMLADSTNSQKGGFSLSESVVEKKMNSLFAHKDGMIIVAVFASSIERIQDLVTAAKINNKHVAFSGRSLIKYTQIAEELGYLDLYDIVIPIERINKYPREKIVCITTGTQGEPYSSLSLMAANAHKHIKVEQGDVIIFSSSVIPGNEMAVSRMINNLFDLGANLVEEDKKLLHVSGHASSEDLRLMYRLVKPKYFIPVHGEKRHLIKHIELVESLKGLKAKGFLLYNGDVLEIDENLNADFGEPIEIRNIYVDGKGVGDLEDSIFHDREQLATGGAVVVDITAVRKENNKYDIKVDIESKGFTYNGGEKNGVKKNEKLIIEGKNAATEAVRKLLDKNKRTPSTIKYEVREALKRKFIQIIGREPVIFVCLHIDNFSNNNINNTNKEETTCQKKMNNHEEKRMKKIFKKVLTENSTCESPQKKKKIKKRKED